MYSITVCCTYGCSELTLADGEGTGQSQESEVYSIHCTLIMLDAKKKVIRTQQKTLTKTTRKVYKYMLRRPGTPPPPKHQPVFNQLCIATTSNCDNVSKQL